MKVLETDRLVLSHLALDDAPFILELLNDPSFIRFIGDRGVRTVDDAREYILNGPVASYAQNGFGLYLTALKATGESVGICGLVKRESLADVDIGFAFLPQFTGMGYGVEAGTAVLIHAYNDLNLKRIVAITLPDNVRSMRLLEKLGLHFERMVKLSKDDLELKMFVTNC